MTTPLTGVGIFEAALRFGPEQQALDCAAELEELGYSALWIPDIGGALLDRLETLLASTSRITVASGVLNLWFQDSAEVAARRAALAKNLRDRLLLGIGASHAQIVNPRHPGKYTRPLAVMNHYLDALDAADPPVPADRRLLAALGPKMLGVARDRSAGSLTYLVTPSTRRSRERPSARTGCWPPSRASSSRPTRMRPAGSRGRTSTSTSTSRTTSTTGADSASPRTRSDAQGATGSSTP
ncbi:LLM class flavin-dependent oxidoreductase [Saccharopolyspora sp. ASAGF58]|uniref:LLM class flavin-dependent oxidoreductase n=1 Tax=Saccharopolyspora sp. ASAGF58 TaxID=2719023 RepID=UPI001B3086A7|nr:LLM class flavin-dependent oxidoreductase [Saccharopolyspora sp. ASAGF58]